MSKSIEDVLRAAYAHIDVPSDLWLVGFLGYKGELYDKDDPVSPKTSLHAAAYLAFLHSYAAIILKYRRTYYTIVTNGIKPELYTCTGRAEAILTAKMIVSTLMPTA